MKFVDLFAGLGGFHLALASLGHECVFVSEADLELQVLYARNFPSAKKLVRGDIRQWKDAVPAHDILCAGFPCQPFSKSGSQLGLMDKTRGTLFHQIAAILDKHHPQYVILENVGNFERHDNGRTWTIVRERLEELGYNVRGTTHIASGGHGLISPHHLGYPHTRERFFIVGRLTSLPNDPFPKRRRLKTSLGRIVQRRRELSHHDVQETALTKQQIDCIDHWNKLLHKLPDRIALPSFPIWGDEILASYPFRTKVPYDCTPAELREHVRYLGVARDADKSDMLALLPGYARGEKPFPAWKVDFITQNRRWFSEISRWLTPHWVAKLLQFPPSLRKLEWNCHGEKRDIWRYVLQFRPSGLRVKRYTSCPALVAMTTTQIPILGPERRFITRVEALHLQGFPDNHELPASRERAFAALGNAVHVRVVRAIARRLLEASARG